MTCIEVMISHPPCKRCNGTDERCPSCKGHSTIVEYKFFYGPRNATKARWADWPVTK